MRGTQCGLALSLCPPRSLSCARARLFRSLLVPKVSCFVLLCIRALPFSHIVWAIANGWTLDTVYAHHTYLLVVYTIVVCALARVCVCGFESAVVHAIVAALLLAVYAITGKRLFWIVAQLLTERQQHLTIGSRRLTPEHVRRMQTDHTASRTCCFEYLNFLLPLFHCGYFSVRFPPISDGFICDSFLLSKCFDLVGSCRDLSEMCAGCLRS